MIRVVLGFLLAPLLPMAPFILLNLIANHSLQGAGPLLVMGALYGYPAMLVVGVPLYVHAKRKGVLSFERTVKAAALTGAALGAIVPMPFIHQALAAGALAVVLLGLVGALIGWAVGCAFWAIAGAGADIRQSDEAV